MEAIVGVRFHEAGKIYYFASAGYENIEVGEYVVVETSRGQELARVVIAPGQVLNAELTEPLKPLTRLAYDDDIVRAKELQKKAEAAVEVARQKARAARLPMKISSGSYDLAGTRLTLLFTSEGRVDFRDLAREVGAATGSQVQLRQIGPRDQAKIVGGYGRCGRRLCCSSWLIIFPAISIKMAKEQDLPLNPSKISGQCGRLLCCLSYENDLYRQVRQALPRPGTWVSTPTGNARILAVNVPRETVTLQMETAQVIDVPIQELGMDRGLVRILNEPPQAAPVRGRPAPPPEPRPTQAQRPAPPRPPATVPQASPPAETTPAPSAVQPAAPPHAGAPGHRRRRRRGGPGPRLQPPR